MNRAVTGVATKQGEMNRAVTGAATKQGAASGARGPGRSRGRGECLGSWWTFCAEVPFGFHPCFLRTATVSLFTQRRPFFLALVCTAIAAASVTRAPFRW